MEKQTELIYKSHDELNNYQEIKKIMENSKIVYIFATLEDAKFIIDSKIRPQIKEYLANGGILRILLHKDKKMGQIPKFGEINVKYGNFRSKSRIIAGEKNSLMSGYIQTTKEDNRSIIYYDDPKTVKVLFAMCKNMWGLK